MATGDAKHGLVSGRMRNRRSGHDLLFSGYGYTLAGLGHYEPRHRQWTDHIYRAGNNNSDAANGTARRVQNGDWHVIDFHGLYGSGNEPR